MEVTLDFSLKVAHALASIHVAKIKTMAQSSKMVASGPNQKMWIVKRHENWCNSRVGPHLG